jgi:hypothetical protein
MTGGSMTSSAPKEPLGEKSSVMHLPTMLMLVTLWPPLVTVRLVLSS